MLAKGNLNNERTAFDVVQFDSPSLCCVISQSISIFWWLHFFKYTMLMFLPFLAQLPTLNYNKQNHPSFHIPTMTFLDGFVKWRHMDVGCGIFLPVIGRLNPVISAFLSETQISSQIPRIWPPARGAQSFLRIIFKQK